MVLKMKELTRSFIQTISSGIKYILLLCLVAAGLSSGAQPKPNDFTWKIPDFKEMPKIAWTCNLTGPLYSSPVIDNDRVYFGGCDSILYALELSTGNVIWKFHSKGQIRSSVCTDDSCLYLNGGDGNLYALNKALGTIVWTFATKGERKYDFADYFHSTPVLLDDILYFGSGDGNVYAVNKMTGKQVWSFPTGGIVHSKPAIDGNRLFIGSFDGYVYGINRTTGELLWKFKTVGHMYFPKGEVQGSPAAFNGLVFVGARDYNVYALDQEKGYCHWNKAFTSGWGLSTTIHDSVLYIGSADERVMIAANPESGNEYWNRKMEFLVFGNNVFTGSLMYAGTTIGKLHAIDVKTGDDVWSFETDAYQNNRSKYFKSDDSYRDDIYSIILSNEQFLDVENELGGIFSTPAISWNYIVVTCSNGTVYCLKRA